MPYSRPRLCLGVSVPRVLLAGVLLVVCPATAEELCEGFGPQSARDITQPEGTNPAVFSHAPPASELQLCNVHFHRNAEHKGPGFSKYVGDGRFDGYACDDAGDPSGETVCRNVQAGDTVEYHWVYTSCEVDLKPGMGLDACSSAMCGNPQLRVEAQVYRVEADGDDPVPPEPPTPGEGTVQYLGSTTGPDFNAEACSPLQVTWSVRPQCGSIGLASLSAWCEDNPFDERYAHGVRRLVTELPLLSKIDD